LYVNYKSLNTIIIKTRYPLLLIKKIFDRITGVKIFTKFNIKTIYYQIRIRENDKQKIAFRTKYRLYEYLIIPFNLINIPASF